MSRGVVRCLVAAVLFGASAPAASKLAGGMPALVLAGLLYVGGGLVALPATLLAPPRVSALQREWRRVGLAVVFGGGIGPVLLVLGLARTPAATASILLNLELAATVALAAVVFHEHLGWRLVLGASVVTSAGIVLAWEPGATPTLGALCLAGACIAWAVDNSVTAKLDQLSPAHIVMAKGAGAGLVNLTLGVLLTAHASAIRPSDVVAALGIGAVGYGLSITLWVGGARELGAARGQVIFATAPFIGALIAWFLLGEHATAAQLAATAVAAIGVGISLTSGHEHLHPHEPLDHQHEHQHRDGHHDDHVHEPIPSASHAHHHRHSPTRHSHAHVPDLHHRHPHN